MWRTGTSATAGETPALPIRLRRAEEKDADAVGVEGKAAAEVGRGERFRKWGFRRRKTDSANIG